ncbi:MAG: ABC transporter ATP-binding protein [Propionibacteriaceae bacterium]|jgi:branched-chain amino acid transport system ATP-binding protein|nr:ABC transporter ATP-binding protein [Propionibacteriaceae bacterium]
MNWLQLDAVDVCYGRVQALRQVSLQVEEGEIVALLGNNGAGKSTTLNLISGFVRPSAGSLTWQGQDISRLKPHQLVAQGIVQAPEGRRIFSTMTVHENLLLGGYLVRDPAQIKQRLEQVYDLMPRLRERSGQEGGTLSGGEQQMLAIGRALVSGPRLLLLDEPSMGLAPLLVAQVMRIIAAVNRTGTTVFVVEQNAKAALQIAHRAYVLDTGTVSLSGPAAELAQDPRVVEAYLGGA